MKKTAEIVITSLMFGALYFLSVASHPSEQNRTSVVTNGTAGEVLLLADGTDPMPGKKR